MDAFQTLKARLGASSFTVDWYGKFLVICVLKRLEIPSMKSFPHQSIEAMKPLVKIALEEGVDNVYIKTRERGLEGIE